MVILVDGWNERLKARREELGLTQQEVAQRMGGKTAPITISRYERGERIPSLSNIRKLAVILGIDFQIPSGQVSS